MSEIRISIILGSCKGLHPTLIPTPIPHCLPWNLCLTPLYIMWPYKQKCELHCVKQVAALGLASKQRARPALSKAGRAQARP